MPNLNIAPLPKRRQVEAELHKQLWAVGILEQADSYAHERGFNKSRSFAKLWWVGHECEDRNIHENHWLFVRGDKAEGVPSVPVTGPTGHPVRGIF